MYASCDTTIWKGLKVAKTEAWKKQLKGHCYIKWGNKIIGNKEPLE